MEIRQEVKFDMTISNFLNYLDRNFNISIQSRRFIANILDYAVKQNLDNEESAKLADTIIHNNEGITLDMLRQIDFHKQEGE